MGWDKFYWQFTKNIVISLRCHKGIRLSKRVLFKIGEGGRQRSTRAKYTYVKEKKAEKNDKNKWIVLYANCKKVIAKKTQYFAFSWKFLSKLALV